MHDLEQDKNKMPSGEITEDGSESESVEPLSKKPDILFENFLPEQLQEMKDEFLKHQNAGLPIEMWAKLQKDLENGTLSTDYTETVGKIKDYEISCYGTTKEEATKFLDFIEQTFPDEIMKEALVNKVELAFDLVNISLPEDNPLSIDGCGYSMPVEQFIKYWSQFSQEQKDWFSSHTYRGESFSNWFMEGYSDGKYFESPVIIFNQDYDANNLGLIKGTDVNDLGLAYLESIPEDKRREVYHNGTIAHEIAHNLYAYTIYNKELETEWKKLIDANGNITKYADKWEQKRGVRDYNENFAEAIRLYTSVPGYMQNDNLSQIRAFILRNFSKIKEAA